MVGTKRKQTLEQRKESYIKSGLEHFCRVHFPADSTYNGRVAVCARKVMDGKPMMKTVMTPQVGNLCNSLQEMYFNEHLNYYITANTLTKGSRRSTNLFSLNNIVIDIDCHGGQAPEVLGWFLPQFVKWLLVRVWQLDENPYLPFTGPIKNQSVYCPEADLFGDEKTYLPLPNTIVITGRGVQLWWALEPCYKTYLDLYNEVKLAWMQKLQEMISDEKYFANELKVDFSASKSAVGLYRLPCTVNTNTKRLGSMKVLHGQQYSLLDLKKYYTSPQRMSSNNAQKSNYGSNIISLDCVRSGFRRVEQLEKLRQIRELPAGEEYRDLFCFHVYNAYLFAGLDQEQAWDKLIAFNEGFHMPLSESDLKNVIVTSRRKNGYKYKDQTIIDMLSISEAEQEAIGMGKCAYNQVQKVSKREQERTERRLAKQEKYYEIVVRHESGESKSAIARAMGVSRTTVIKIIRLHESGVVFAPAKTQSCNEESKASRRSETIGTVEVVQTEEGWGYRYHRAGAAITCEQESEKQAEPAPRTLRVVRQENGWAYVYFSACTKNASNICFNYKADDALTPSTDSTHRPLADATQLNQVTDQHTEEFSIPRPGPGDDLRTPLPADVQQTTSLALVHPPDTETCA